MKFFTTKPATRKTSFSEFISSASSKEKKRVYSVVLEKTSESQKSIVAAAKAKSASAA
jgi:hypothetical protein